MFQIQVSASSRSFCSQVQQLERGRVIPQVVPLFTPVARLNVSYGSGALS